MRRTILTIGLVVFSTTTLQAQTLELTGGLGYTITDEAEWFGDAASGGAPLNYAGAATVIFGRRTTGLQAGVELGLQHLLAYDVTVGTQVLPANARAFRAMGVVRFWLMEQSWFGEFGVGAYLFDGFTDPVVAAAAGTILGSGKVQFPVKARIAFVADTEAAVIPIALQAGVSYPLGG